MCVCVCPHVQVYGCVSTHTHLLRTPVILTQSGEQKPGRNAIKGALWCSIVTSRRGYLSLPAALIGFQLPAPAS